MKTSWTERLPFLRMFGSAVIDQALLSAGNLLVGLILIRYASEMEYGAYVLVTGAIMLAASLQNAFIAPQMINRMTALDREGRGRLTGGLYREQRSLVVIVSLLSLAAIAALWWSGPADGNAPLLLAAVGAIVLGLRREYFRMVLLAYRRATQVLQADVLYVLLLVAGVGLAVRWPQAAALATLALGFAAWIGGSGLSRMLQRDEAWDLQGEPGILRRIAPLGLWSVTGAVIHWTFSHGYNFLVAATLDVTAVAAIAATRLLLMPINLLSTGIGSLMLPLASGWLHRDGPAMVLARLAQFAAGIAAAAAIYLIVLWLARDWIFAHVLKKQFEDGDALLMLWSAAFMAMVARDQLVYLLIARQRFRRLAALAGVSAAISLAVSLEAMRHYGVIGAPLGVLVGELINLAGILVMSWRETRHPTPSTEPVTA